MSFLPPALAVDCFSSWQASQWPSCAGGRTHDGACVHHVFPAPCQAVTRWAEVGGCSFAERSPLGKGVGNELVVSRRQGRAGRIARKRAPRAHLRRGSQLAGECGHCQGQKAAGTAVPVDLASCLAIFLRSPRCLCAFCYLLLLVHPRTFIFPPSSLHGLFPVLDFLLPEFLSSFFTRALFSRSYLLLCFPNLALPSLGSVPFFPPFLRSLFGPFYDFSCLQTIFHGGCVWGRNFSSCNSSVTSVPSTFSSSPPVLLPLSLRCICYSLL